MTLPTNFQFSQGSLQDYVDCPRRFQLKYIKQLAWPALEIQPAIENEDYLQRGANFHRLVQQHQLGVPIKLLTHLIEKDPNLGIWWENYISALESLECLALTNQNCNRYPEISLTAPIDNFRIIGKYDLLSSYENKFIIYDWKTSRKLPKLEWIKKSLQTRLYPFLLVQAGSHLNNDKPIRPGQIKMIYWFANFPGSKLIFEFNNQNYDEDHLFLIKLIEEIKELDESPARMTENERRCRFCGYRSLCNRGIEAGFVEELDYDDYQDEFDFELDLEQIAEIEI